MTRQHARGGSADQRVALRRLLGLHGRWHGHLTRINPGRQKRGLDISAARSCSRARLRPILARTSRPAHALRTNPCYARPCRATTVLLPCVLAVGPEPEARMAARNEVLPRAGPPEVVPQPFGHRPGRRRSIPKVLGTPPKYLRYTPQARDGRLPVADSRRNAGGRRRSRGARRLGR